METSYYKRPACKHNGSIRTDLPLTIAARASKRRKASGTDRYTSAFLALESDIG